MAVVYVAPSTRGTGNGSSPANAMDWKAASFGVDAVVAADAGAAPYEIRFCNDYGAYVHTTGSQVATFNTAPVNRVVLTGWSVARNTYDFARISSNRSYPYVAPAPNNDNVFVPLGSDGETGLIVWNLDLGVKNLRFQYFDCFRLQGLVRALDTAEKIDIMDIYGRECRYIVAAGDPGAGKFPGFKGTVDTPCLFQRINLKGFTKYVIRLSSSSYVYMSSITGDGQGDDGNDQIGDGFTVGLAIAGNVPNAASDHIILDGFSFKNLIGYQYKASTTAEWTITATTPPTGGTYTLSYGGVSTTPIAFNANKATIKQTLGAISPLSTRSVFVNGTELPVGPVSFTIGGELMATNPAAITMDPSGLTGGTYTFAQTRTWSAPVAVDGYTQGDGITTEEHDYAIIIRNGSVTRVGDGGLDLKSSDTHIENVTVTDAKRSFRVHPFLRTDGVLSPVLIRCRSMNPRARAYPTGWPLAGQIPAGSQSGLQANGSLTAIDFYHEDQASAYAANSAVVQAEGTSRIVLLGCTVKRVAGSVLTITSNPPNSVISIHNMDETVL